MHECYCENLHCEHCRGEGCANPASSAVRCEYIGAICDECAAFMPAEYLHAVTA